MHLSKNSLPPSDQRNSDRKVCLSESPLCHELSVRIPSQKIYISTILMSEWCQKELLSGSPEWSDRPLSEFWGNLMGTPGFTLTGANASEQLIRQNTLALYYCITLYYIECTLLCVHILLLLSCFGCSEYNILLSIILSAFYANNTIYSYKCMGAYFAVLRLNLVLKIIVCSFFTVNCVTTFLLCTKMLSLRNLKFCHRFSLEKM